MRPVSFVWIALLLLGAAPAVPQDIREAPEYEIKAAFLYNFATFVEWPDGTFKNKTTPFKIGVLGKDPFSDAIEGIFNGKTAKGRPLRVKRSAFPSLLADCQIVFVPRAEAKQLAALRDTFAKKAILIVGESPGFAANGAAVNFFIEENHVKFEINRAAERRAGLTIRANLLRVARLVEERK